ncbi:uncharacterized protein LOC113391405 isoform X3 [Vanessa tameamea]|uniref:Uncharacterized protein LOC113391405 isoform X3 n=1 Tax=Vanessa tameamea TaxID=334116 RepID=A0ABM4AY65_VANTA
MSILFLFMLCFVTVLGANKHTKSLTESMGQEVIEINGPLKELPPDLEEEPSAENDDEKATSTTIQVATAKVVSEQVLENVKPDNLKDTEKIDRQKDDEEARIEKELADIYKDSLDYKGDSAEVIKETTDTKSTEMSEKPVARVRNNFKFQPDSNNPSEINIFRTSIDDISCKKSKLSESVV